MVVTIGKDRLYVECKRIKSLKKLASRMKEASNQINARIGANRKNKYGLIALDVTDVLLPEGAVTATSDVRLYDMEIQKAITDFAREQQDVSNKNAGRNVAGILFEFSSSAFFSHEEKEPALGFGRAACMYRQASQNKKALALVSGFIDKIANQNL